MFNSIARTNLPGDILISTVELPDFGGGAKYETMIFGMFDDEYQERCSTIGLALEQHKKAIRKALTNQ